MFNTNINRILRIKNFFSTLSKNNAMLIQQRQEVDKGSFFVEIDQRVLAEMTYSLSAPNFMIITHTEVDDSLRGKNLGYQLVNRGLVFAREKNTWLFPYVRLPGLFLIRKKMNSMMC